MTSTIKLVCLLLILGCLPGRAQTKRQSLIYVDPSGLIRYTKNKAEAAFYGVNYCAPFAHGYRAIKTLGIDHQQAIDADVYHFARMGADAFRVHMWDTEISDSLGNLLNNEHLRLFDYLLAQLKKRNIRVIITPIAYWGNGYPERDERTPGFSRVYGKGQANSNEQAIRAQEEYIRQLFRHVNPYTQTTYGEEETVVAVELNNEPSHSGPKTGVTAYINRVNAALRSTGWDKPIFYNISQNPTYAGAVARSAVEGHSFQWYPSGLVAGRMLPGNALPLVDTYRIPFDTITTFRNKARIVYEFDAGDVYASYMYPAMARSFRGAGFQWATQFAYDPMAIAYANTDYQTHYLNLAYTPSKAISMLIASRVFHDTPRLKTYGVYPQDSVFGPFRLSYTQSLSEMNTEQAFYHSNPTTSRPLDLAKLQHLAGVGSSAVVTYQGRGAYFLDKLATGVWRLEVMPDAIPLRDPFERPSLSKEVTTIRYAAWPMRIQLPDLGATFSVMAQNAGNTFGATAANGQFIIRPGTYLLLATGAEMPPVLPASAIGLTEFHAPAAPEGTEPLLLHRPYADVSPQKPLLLAATILGLDSADKAVVVLQNAGRFQTVMMRPVAPYQYEVVIPAEKLQPGPLQYRIQLQKEAGFWTYPAGTKGNPAAWDYLPGQSYQSMVVAENSRLTLFECHTDRTELIVYKPDDRTGKVSFVPDEDPGRLLLKVDWPQPAGDEPMALQYYFGDRIAGRRSELNKFKKLVLRGKSGGAGPVTVRVKLIQADGSAYATTVRLPQQLTAVEVPLSQLTRAAYLLLPRPYPEFQPLYFRAAGAAPFKRSAIEKLEITLEPAAGVLGAGQPLSFWLDYVGLTN